MGIFRRRKSEPEALDQTGAATSYPHRSGATPPPPEKPPKPAGKPTNAARNASHVTGFSPLLGPGQLTGEDDDR